MAIADITKPMALDETLQETNDILATLGKDTSLQAIATALATLGLTSVGDLSQLTTEQKTSLVAAINEIDENLEGVSDDLEGVSDDLEGVSDDVDVIKGRMDADTTSISGNPISIPDLKSNQLAINPIITFEPIQAGSGTPSPSNVRAISGYDKVEVESCGKNLVSGRLSGYAINTNGTFSANVNYDMVYAPVVKGASYVISSDNNAVMGWFEDKPTASSQAYDATRYSYAVGIAYTAPITGWVAFRTVAGFTTPQVEHGTSQTTYESPNKTTDLSESLGETVYGATWYPRTGILKSKEKANYIVIDGNANWQMQTSGSNKRFYVTGVGANINESSTDHICNMALVASGNNASQCYTVDDRFALYTASNGTVYLSGNIASDVTALKALLNTTPLQICYTVVDSAEKTIQLTPHEISLLSNYAYVSTNGTNISLDYHNGELASLADVSQLGETVNLIGNGMIKHQRIQHSFGNVTAGQFYDYALSADYPHLGFPNIVSLTMTTPTGNAFDHKAVLLYRPSSNLQGTVIEYQCGTTGTNMTIYIDVLYL